MKNMSCQADPSISQTAPKPEVRGAQQTSERRAGTISSTMGDYAGMKKIIVEYVDGLPDDVLKMQELLRSNELPLLRRVVHQLRGTGGGYGFDPISELATIAEAAIDAPIITSRSH